MNYSGFGPEIPNIYWKFKKKQNKTNKKKQQVTHTFAFFFVCGTTRA